MSANPMCADGLTNRLNVLGLAIYRLKTLLQAAAQIECGGNDADRDFELLSNFLNIAADLATSVGEQYDEAEVLVREVKRRFDGGGAS